MTPPWIQHHDKEIQILHRWAQFTKADHKIDIVLGTETLAGLRCCAEILRWDGLLRMCVLRYFFSQLRDFKMQKCNFILNVDKTSLELKGLVIDISIALISLLKYMIFWTFFFSDICIILDIGYMYIMVDFGTRASSWSVPYIWQLPSSFVYMTH